MTHSFDTEIAKLVGVEAAILFSNIQFWCDKNRANLKHCYHGNYWTYNSKNAFLELFPYMTYNQIKTALKKLKDADLIDVKSGLGDDKWDKSNWYSIINHSIGEKTPMDRLKNSNDACVSTNADIKPSSIALSQAQELVNTWNSFAQDNSLQRVMKLTEKRIKKIQARFKDTETFDKVFIAMLQKIKQSSFLLGINSTWKVDFDFLIDSEQNYVKVIEGKYDDKDVK